MLRREIRAVAVATVWFSGVTLISEAAVVEHPVDSDQVSLRLTEAKGLFISNQGQTDPAVAYYVPTFAGTTFVTRRGQIVHSLRGRNDKDLTRWTVTETLVGSTPRPLGLEATDARTSHFVGSDPSQWRTGVATYGSLSLGQVWPGVQVFLRGRQNSVEKLFTLSPGVSAGGILVRVSGARSLRVDEKGRLVARTGGGRIAWSAPIAYQEDRGERRSVGVSYWTNGRDYGFRLGAHERALPVTIDPLLQATYLGGNLNDYAFAVAIHPRTGEVFVTGRTESLDFPGTTGGPQARHGGHLDDVFVGKFNAALTTLEQTTYFGGTSIDIAYAIAIHPSTYEVFVVGQTGSTNLPATTGGAQPRYAGHYDAFVARLSSTLTDLNQVTYLGGSWADGAGALVIHPTNGEIFVSGWTISPDFPRTPGGAQETRSSALGYDAFVARLDPGLMSLNQATYLGGSRTDEATDIAIHKVTGEVFVSGQTESPDFPGTAEGAQSEYGGIKDAFVARLTETLTSLNRSTYLGGSLYDSAIALAIDPIEGAVLVAGGSNSTDLPGVLGGAQAAPGGAWDGFVARLNADLTVLTQASYVGGAGIDLVTGLAIHGMTGEVFVAGETNSTNLPGTSAGAQPSYGGGVLDAFVARFPPRLTPMNETTYLGGSDRETAWDIVIDPATGDGIVAGDTRSENFPATIGGAQPSFGGGDLYGGDAFVVRFTGNPVAGPALTPPPARTRSHPRRVEFR